MRPWLLSLAVPLVLLACSSGNQATSTAEASTAAGADDGSTAACTSMGGMCLPYTANCPPPRQNATLCGSTVLLCCLPSTPAPPEASPESGVQTGRETGADSEVESGPVDASSDAPNG
jgi:hypothetical protein